ncbi:MAG: oxidoreductase [Paenibacillus sp.]|nr:oxidoreductase [Paenibacillus sp.]
MPYSFAIMGCQHGHISTFIEEMTALGHTCVGIYEEGDRKLAKTLSDRYGVPLVDEKEALLEPSVHIIGSSAINNEKLGIMEWCERHGKHIMLDKPIATNREQLQRLEAVIRRGSIQVGMLLSERFRPSTNELKRQIDAGTLGGIVSISLRKPHRLRADTRPEWHFSRQQSGGIIIDLLIHDFDLLRWLTGREVVTIQSVQTKNILPEHPDFYDVASAQVVMEGGIVGQLYTSWHTPDKSWTWGDCRIFVCGTKGSAELRLNGDPAIAEGELMFSVTRDEPFRRADMAEVPGTVSADFVNRIEGKPSVISHRDVLLASQAAVEADENAFAINNTIDRLDRGNL